MSRERRDVRRRDVHHGLGHSEARGRRAVVDRDRRAFAHRERFARVAVVARRRDGHVADGHLPRADELIARDRPPTVRSPM